jgi:hypothetical protein
MAYLAPHFDYDVFVSYSHADPLGRGDSPLKRWTLSLIDKLERDILAIAVEFDSLHIWHDPEIDPTMHLTPELRGKVYKPCILMIIMSNRYLTSAWCKDELEWFREQIHGRANEQGRIFIIRAQPTDETAWPDFLRDARGHAMLGFQFHDSRGGEPFGWPDFTDKNEDFYRELSRVSMALKRRLREMKQRAEERSHPRLGASSVMQGSLGPRRIYLHAGRDENDLRDDLKVALEKDGFSAVTMDWGGSAKLMTMENESRTRIAMAKRCEALAFVNADHQSVIIDDFLQVCVDERERIEAARGAPLPCVVLDHSGGHLPFAPSEWGAGHIDVTQAGWQGEFRKWFNHVGNDCTELAQ